jgi:hypothetical protein
MPIILTVVSTSSSDEEPSWPSFLVIGLLAFAPWQMLKYSDVSPCQKDKTNVFEFGNYLFGQRILPRPRPAILNIHILLLCGAFDADSALLSFDSSFSVLKLSDNSCLQSESTTTTLTLTSKASFDMSTVKGVLSFFELGSRGSDACSADRLVEEAGRLLLGGASEDASSGPNPISSNKLTFAWSTSCISGADGRILFRDSLVFVRQYIA